MTLAVTLFIATAPIWPLAAVAAWEAYLARPPYRGH